MFFGLRQGQQFLIGVLVGNTHIRSSRGIRVCICRHGVPGLPPDSERWIGEMNEIAATFEAAGVTPRFHQGAAEVYRLLASTPLAAENRETMDKSRSLEEVVRVYAHHLNKK